MLISDLELGCRRGGGGERERASEVSKYDLLTPQKDRLFSAGKIIHANYSGLITHAMLSNGMSRMQKCYSSWNFILQAQKIARGRQKLKRAPKTARNDKAEQILRN